MVIKQTVGGVVVEWCLNRFATQRATMDHVKLIQVRNCCNELPPNLYQNFEATRYQTSMHGMSKDAFYMHVQESFSCLFILLLDN